MEQIAIEPHVFDQQRIMYWGVLCGYCGIRPGMPVNFLAGRMCTLRDDEKADVIAFVQSRIGLVRRTKQNRKAFYVLDSRTDSDG